MWPTDAGSLIAVQLELADAEPERWEPRDEAALVGGCWACVARGLAGPGAAGDPAWSAAVTMHRNRVVDSGLGAGVTGAPYAPGLLALRLGPVLEAPVRRLSATPDVLLTDAGGRDHPRRAGLAIHLGAVLDLPTVGVTHRPLLARGAWPEDVRGAASDLRLDGEIVARWLRTRAGTRPLVVHPGWRVDVATAVEIVMATTGRHRTPEPLRRARQLARRSRASVMPR
jgi:deoxyribonuclease V